MPFVMISITLAGKGQVYAVCNDFNNWQVKEIMGLLPFPKTEEKKRM